MHCLVYVSCLLLMLISRGKTAMQDIDINGFIHRIYDDLKEYDITCPGENCRTYCYESHSSYPCHCSIQCVRLGTCCTYSFYNRVPQPKLIPACRSVYNGGTYFMVDDCPSGSALTSLCKEEWNKDDDVLKLLPVTSISSFITYKNYYCFRCHETNDDFLYWWLQINSNVFQYDNFEIEVKQLHKRLSLTYHKGMDTWMAIFDEDIGYFPVNISLQIPPEIYDFIQYCEQGVVSSCSDEWSDEDVRIKCHLYMSLKEVRRNNTSILYKNIHCALCNFESLNEVSCREMMPNSTFGDTTPSFSFTHLMDINRADGKQVGNIQKCSDDDIWNPFTEKCRKVSCALPGFKVKNYECVQE